MVTLGNDQFTYEVLEGWGQLPDGWKFKEVAAVGVDSNDNVYAFNRGEHPMIIFDKKGHFLRSWGEGIFPRAHGITMGPDDTIFCTDDGDHTVRKCTLDGKVLFTLGASGKPAPFMSGDPFNRCTPGIYAFGDVKGGPAFTHIAFDDFRILRTNLLAGGDATTTGRLVPYVVYMDPQLARVGLNESEALAQGRNIRVAKLPMGYTGPTRPQELSETRGFMKAIVDADTQQILGVTILGIEGGEMMSVLQVAMMGNLPYTAIRDGIFAHPTLAETLKDLFMSMDMPMAYGQ